MGAMSQACVIRVCEKTLELEATDLRHKTTRLQGKSITGDEGAGKEDRNLEIWIGWWRTVDGSSSEGSRERVVEKVSAEEGSCHPLGHIWQLHRRPRGSLTGGVGEIQVPDFADPAPHKQTRDSGT